MTQHKCPPTAKANTQIAQTNAANAHNGKLDSSENGCDAAIHSHKVNVRNIILNKKQAPTIIDVSF